MLLSMVAGRQIIGIWKAGYRSRSRCMVQAASNASQPPMISSPSTRCCSRPRPMAYRSLTVGTCRLMPSSAPPRLVQPSTSPQCSSRTSPSIRPRKLPLTPSMVCPRSSPSRTAARGRRVHPRRQPADVEHGDPGRAVGRPRVRQRVGDRVEDVDHLGVAVAAHRQRGVVVLGRDPVGQLAGLGDALHQRHLGDPVVLHADQLRDAVRRGRQHLLDGRVAEHGAHRAVEGAGRAAALDVAEDGHPGVLAEPLLQHLAHVVAGDRLVARSRGRPRRRPRCCCAGRPRGRS